ncbi:hypothetical protein [Caenibius sp. WL]|uniref:hypothetical protein n=1 Tax=Caenibius sp. WL TaxID=2872646 RepID=UPI001C98F83A|nr:hypothetical protein [Caenibius sp. WL]QZP07383.1 hypothetical protein K5X80_11945 [Caenibius sp. WL]
MDKLLHSPKGRTGEQRQHRYKPKGQAGSAQSDESISRTGAKTRYGAIGIRNDGIERASRA